jgi:hypothetical protein
VHWHRKPARSFREVTSHDLRMAVLEEALLGRASLFPLAFLDCSGFPIRYPFLVGCYFYSRTEGQKIKQHGKQLPGLLRS